MATEDRKSGALDVDLDAPLTEHVGYHEDPDFRPDPLAMYGTLDTSDTGGGAHQDVRETSPVFTEARALNLKTAARALDPDDPTVAPELVTLPEGSVTVQGTAKTAEQARAEIEGALRNMAANPVGVGGAGPNAQAAAESTVDDESRDEEQERRQRDADTATTSATQSTTEATADQGSTVNHGDDSSRATLGTATPTQKTGTASSRRGSTQK